MEIEVSKSVLSVRVSWWVYSRISNELTTFLFSLIIQKSFGLMKNLAMTEDHLVFCCTIWIYHFWFYSKRTSIITSIEFERLHLFMNQTNKFINLHQNHKDPETMWMMPNFWLCWFLDKNLSNFVPLLKNSTTRITKIRNPISVKNN